jgi:ABC-type multidrug transport system fused ATPase/permease subunit
MDSALPAAPSGAPALPFATIWRLGRIYLGKRPWAITIYIVGCLLCQAVLPPAIALRFGKLTNTSPAAYTDPGATYKTYFQWMGLVAALMLLSAAVRYFTTMLDAVASNWLRRDAFANLMRLGPAYFHRHDPGELTMVINQVCLTAEIGLRQLLVDPIIQALSAVSIGYALYTLLAEAQTAGQENHLMPLICVAGVVAATFLWLVKLVAPRLQRAGNALQQQYLAVSSFTGGALGAPEEIQSMGAEARFAQKHNAYLDEYLSRERRNAFTLESLNLLNQSPGNLLLFALLGVAVHFGTRAPNPHPGTLVGLVLLTPSFMGAIQAIGSWRITKSQAWPALTLVDEILTSRNAATIVPDLATGHIDPAAVEVITPTLPDEPELAPGPALRVCHLTFSYEPGTLPNVLDDVSFSVPPGKITGLVARSGEGKTTFFRLGLRFYDAQRGTIELNGTPHTELELSDLRRRVVLMSRAPAFFQNTVRENLLLARPDASDEKLREECERTGIWPLLQEALTHGTGNPLDAPFHAGEALSGAQRKLFALTRCLLRDPEYLFLDEPTTGMEAETKFDFVGPMRRSCRGKTVIVVDHDLLWQLRFCDYFLVLEGGKVVEHGTGRDLLEQRGAFRQLFDEQTAGLFKLLRTLRELGLVHTDPDEYARAAYRDRALF